MRHRDELARLADGEVDLAIVGGGATGIGCAVDAASRGLRVALLERDDLAAGTSSRSTKLLHGGVRYLEAAVTRLDRGQFHLVRDALAERAVLLRLAPHLAGELRLVTPVPSRRDAAYMWAGLQLYDRLAGRRRLRPSHHLSAAELAASCPDLAPHAAGVAYSDGQFDDARFAVCAALSARRLGAIVATHCAVEGVERDGEGWRLTWHDVLGDQRGHLRARAVINATGPFCDELRRLVTEDAAPLLRVSSGIHLVLPGSRWRSRHAMLIPETSDGRVLFALPWQGHLLVGTSDEPAEPEAHPPPADRAVDYLLAQLNPHLRRPVGRHEILATWSGLRPLVAGGGGDGTKSLSRDHLVHRDGPGLITITGGKWTTYRLMARDAVAAACRDAGIPARRSRSGEIAVAGGAGYHRLDPAWCRGLPADVADHLRSSYGDRAPLVAGLDGGRVRRLVPGLPHLHCEIRWAVEQEGAATAADLLCRRTRLAFLDTAAARGALGEVVDELARALDWDRYRAAAETAVCTELLDRAL